MSTLLHQLGYVPEHEVAGVLGVEIGTLRNWRSKGIGPAYSRAGGTLVYPVESLRDWLSSNLVTPSPLPTLADPSGRPGRLRKGGWVIPMYPRRLSLCVDCGYPGTWDPQHRAVLCGACRLIRDRNDHPLLMPCFCRATGNCSTCRTWRQKELELRSVA
jgi:hypothetical protein